MPIPPGDRTRLPESGLEPEHALIVALLRQMLADRQASSAVVRRETQQWFASGQHHFWLSLVGLPEEALDQALREEKRA